MHRASDVGHRVDGAEHVGDMHHARDLHPAVREQRRQRRKVQLAARHDRDETQLGALLLGDQLPRNQIGVMLHLGQQDRVAGAQVGAAPRLRDQVDRLGAVLGEDDFAGRGRADERRDPAPRVLVGLGRLLGDLVDAAMDVRVAGRVVARHRVEHEVGLLGSGGAVEVDQRPLSPGAEDRELLADLPRVEAHTDPIFRSISARSWSRTGSSGMRASTGSKNASTIRRFASRSGRPRAIR